jgi:Ca2+/Na+ antiporter
MLYDLFAFPKESKLIYGSQVLIVLIYSADYLHLYNDLRLYSGLVSSTENSIRLLPIIGDGLIAIFFRVAFTALTYGQPIGATTALAAIFLIYFVYNEHQFTKKMILVLVWISTINIYSSWWFNPNLCFFVMSLLLFLVYIVYVFYLYQRNVAPKEILPAPTAPNRLFHRTPQLRAFHVVVALVAWMLRAQRR